jgi:hypothetical protein
MPLAEAIRRQQEQQHYQQMQVTSIKATLKRFMDSLTAEQMLQFNAFLHHAAENTDMLISFAGRASVYLTNIHKVCETCLSTTHTSDEHILATEVEAQTAAAPIDPTERFKFYNVCDAGGDFNEVNCRNCGIMFPSLGVREGYGKACPSCTEINKEQVAVPTDGLLANAVMIRYGVCESYTIEGGVSCLECGGEFSNLAFRVKQGINCPLCPHATQDGNDVPPITEG